MKVRNPHFEDNLIVWSDKYSGKYIVPPKGYSEQFDLQWKIALEGNKEYFNNPQASTEDRYIDDRVYEWTGQHPNGTGFLDDSCGTLVLDHPLDPSIIKNKKCIDIGCGMGRWTRTMQRIGAESVLSVDVSESAIKSVSQFNTNILRTDIMRMPEERPELCGKFDFANFWGVAMCTHDPYKAFMSAASTVKQGGAMYLMVYSQNGMHDSRLVNIQRRKFHRIEDTTKRLEFVDHVYNREWDAEYPLIENLKNLMRNLVCRPKGSKVGTLDMLEPYYNWTIPMGVISDWMNKAGFSSFIHLNEYEKNPCAFHILGIDKKI